MTIFDHRHFLFLAMTKMTKKNTNTMAQSRHFLFFIGMTNEKKKRHEDNGYASLSSCLRGVGIKGEDDDNLCDRHHLLVFKGVTTRREKRTQQKEKEPPTRALASSY
jgi:hypothetical protein